MPRFRSIPHEVTAAQWKGEVTPELQALFGTREIAVKSAGDPLLVIHTDGEPIFAETGDWVVRTDYGAGERDEERDIPVFDLDVMEHEDFIESYETETIKLSGLEFNIAVPAILTSFIGEAATDIRVRFVTSQHPRQEVIGALVTQLLPHLREPVMIVECVQALCSEADPDTLVEIRDAVERIMIARSTQH